MSEDESDNVHSVASPSTMNSTRSTRHSTRASTSGIGESEEDRIPVGMLKSGKRSTARSASASTRSTGVKVEVTEETIGEQRRQLLVQKHTELDQIYDKHDDLVREKFHMTNWRGMLGYDPKVAKTDDTEVFRDYKANYDLYHTAEQAAGPSRRTRRAANERRLSIAGLPSPSSSKVPKQSATHKRKPSTEVLDARSASARVAVGKGKGKEREILEAHDADDDSLSSPPATYTAPPWTRTTRRNSSVSSSLLSSLTPLSDDDEESTRSISVSAAPHRTGVKRGRITLTDVEAQDAASQMSPGKGKKKQKANNGKSLPIDDHNASKVGPAEQGSPATRRNRRMDHQPVVERSQKVRPAVPLFHEVGSNPPPSPKSPQQALKRIKLIVRKPLPSYTNPYQLPEPPKHGRSLTTLLSTFIPPDRSKQAEKEATIRFREAKFRQDGRFIPGTDVLFGTKVDIDNLPPPYEPPNRDTKDHWDTVIESVVSQHQARGARPWPRGKDVAAQVSASMKGHWDAEEVKRGKAQGLEEKKLRALAKSTVKAVVNEWKRAVDHIRRIERQKEEEEEARRGQEHLDAILDQSGHLLSTQQSRLRKGLSRASSVSLGMSGYDQDSDDETDEGLDVDDLEADGAESRDGDLDEEDEGLGRTSEVGESEFDDDDPGAGSSMLLMDRPSPSLEPDPGEPQAESTSARVVLSPALQRDEDEESMAELDHLMYPDPETSPIREKRTSPFLRAPLVDYDSSSAQSSTPTVPGELKLPKSPSLQPQSHVVLDELEIQGDLDMTSPLEEEFPKSRGESPANDDAPHPVLGHRSSPSPLFSERETTADIGITSPIPEDLPAPSRKETPTLDDDLPADDEVEEEDPEIPGYLKPYAVAPVDYDPSAPVTPPLLLRGTLRPYQQSGLEWLAGLHTNNVNGILADEMGLGKTIQTIALLAHLACDRGIWGPHLIVVPTSVILNWEMEFKKFLPGFKVISYHGGPKRRKELRQGWMDKFRFNVCITSYTLASKDQTVFKRKPWYYMILDEAHMIKNFKSQRWNILLMFRSWRRLLLTGTPLQNNLTELWALLQFLMSGSTFANLKEFSDWFSNPLEKAVEMSNTYDEDTLQRVSKLHTVLRPYLLRRLKRDVEKELPQKYEHLLLCPLSKRQRFLYDEFMSRAQTTQDLQSGVYQKIANILMQLRKVCNHPDLFEVRPIVTSFAMKRSASAVADFEVKELLIRKRWLEDEEEAVDLDLFDFLFTPREGTVSQWSAARIVELDATTSLPYFDAVLEDAPPKDTRTIAGFRRYTEYQQRAEEMARWSHIAYLNRLRCRRRAPMYDQLLIAKVSKLHTPIVPAPYINWRSPSLADTCFIPNQMVKTYEEWEAKVAKEIDLFAFATPAVVALDVPRLALATASQSASESALITSLPDEFDRVLHRAAVKLQIAFPDPSLLQYDCGKLQKLAELLREKKLGGHRVLIFTQMTRVLDILEIFLNFHGYLYLRLDGATKIEDRQYITERFNADPRIFCFISSSRSGGVGINLTGADTVVFFDSDFNPQMDRQCEDRAHRIGQIRDVHIYRFVSQYTVEEAMLRKANQKRSLDDLVIQKGEFDWRALFNDESTSALTKALGEYDDADDARAAALAENEAFDLEGADEVDFGGDGAAQAAVGEGQHGAVMDGEGLNAGHGDEEGEDGEGGTTVDYMLAFVQEDWSFFREWRT
ncbi:helicase SWR1 [Ephemerocybe angulata]|uniref:DNA helicase n=1 Tax=Ephemerocybe angulata TaxID=980116 RepID=A0A8H6IBH2_9AGAR|nr:helicase SWR1 [Tulosesus angulatus]